MAKRANMDGADYAKKSATGGCIRLPRGSGRSGGQRNAATVENALENTPMTARPFNSANVNVDAPAVAATPQSEKGN